FFHSSFFSSFLLPLFFPSFTLLSFLLPFLTFAFHALVFPSGNAFSSTSYYSLYRLLRLIQLEPLNVETSFKLCRVGLVKDTYAMYAMLSFFEPLYFLRYKKKTNTISPIDLHWAIMTSS